MKIIAAMVILITSSRIQIGLKPYKNEEYNDLELFAIFAGILTLSSGLVYTQSDSVNSLNLVFLVLVFLSNSFFLLEWIYHFLCIYHNKFKKLQSVTNLLKLILRKKPNKGDKVAKVGKVDRTNEISFAHKREVRPGKGTAPKHPRTLKKK